MYNHFDAENSYRKYQLCKLLAIDSLNYRGCF